MRRFVLLPYTSRLVIPGVFLVDLGLMAFLEVGLGVLDLEGGLEEGGVGMMARAMWVVLVDRLVLV